MITKSTRESFISLVQEMAGMISTYDVSAEQRPSRIERDRKDLNKILKQIEESRNPFELNIETEESKHKLFNVNTGKATGDDVRESLLKIPQHGKKMHKEFIERCTKDSDQFEEKISIVKMVNFSHDFQRIQKHKIRV